MSGCTGAGKEHSQAANPSWHRNIAYLRHNTQCINGGWPGRRNPHVPQSLLRDRLQNQSSETENNCIVHHLFCIFCIIIVVVVFIIPSFVFLLSCLYLNPWVLRFVHSPSCPTEEGEKWARGCLVLGCQLPGQTMTTPPHRSDEPGSQGSN